MSSSSAAENRKLGRLREGEEEELEGEDVLRRSLKNEFFVNCYKLLEKWVLGLLKIKTYYFCNLRNRRVRKYNSASRQWQQASNKI